MVSCADILEKHCCRLLDGAEVSVEVLSPLDWYAELKKTLILLKSHQPQYNLHTPYISVKKQ